MDHAKSNQIKTKQENFKAKQYFMQTNNEA